MYFLIKNNNAKARINFGKLQEFKEIFTEVQYYYIFTIILIDLFKKLITFTLCTFIFYTSNEM
jgi:hypothetical protein